VFSLPVEGVLAALADPLVQTDRATQAPKLFRVWAIPAASWRLGKTPLCACYFLLQYQLMILMKEAETNVEPISALVCTRDCADLLPTQTRIVRVHLPKSTKTTIERHIWCNSMQVAELSQDLHLLSLVRRPLGYGRSPSAW